MLLRSDISLARLHKIMQVLMGWYDYHLYQYQIRGKTHGPPREDDEDYGHRESVRIEVSTVFAAGANNFLYEYDFGDGWEVDIHLEETLPPSKQKWDAVASMAVDMGRQRTAEGCTDTRAWSLRSREDPVKEYQQIVEWIGDRFDREGSA